MKKITMWILFALLCLGSFFLCSCEDDTKTSSGEKTPMTVEEKKIAFVQDAHFNNYPDISVGSGINLFFTDIQWSYDSSRDCVTMKGNAYYQDKEALYHLTFTFIDENSFSLDQAYITDVNSQSVTTLTNNMIKDLIESIYKGKTEPVPETQKPSSTPTPGNKCTYCSGSGNCSHCILGDCDYCSGEGYQDCTRCFMGNCQQCAGDGGYYNGYGDNFKWVKCTSCRGTGSCSSCSGMGEKRCTYCSGRGNCTYCRGSGDCQFCDGTGRK